METVQRRFNVNVVLSLSRRKQPIIGAVGNKMTSRIPIHAFVRMLIATKKKPSHVPVVPQPVKKKLSAVTVIKSTASLTFQTMTLKIFLKEKPPLPIPEIQNIGIVRIVKTTFPIRMVRMVLS